MASLTTILTGVVGIAFVLGLFAWCGFDAESTVSFLAGNWSTVLLAVQIIVVYILAATGHRIASLIVLCTALVTVMGKVMA